MLFRSLKGDEVQALICQPIALNGDAQGAPLRIRARHYVIAGGAINSPALLLRSQAPDPHGLLGKRTPVGGVISDDLEFVRYLLETEGVATIHGAAYGLASHFRLSFATSQAVLDDACTRITRACAALT